MSESSKEVRESIERSVRIDLETAVNELEQALGDYKECKCPRCLMKMADKAAVILTKVVMSIKRYSEEEMIEKYEMFERTKDLLNINKN